MKFIKLILLCTLAYSLHSCNGFRGLAGPSYFKCYNKSEETDNYKKALNLFYDKHLENIIDYNTLVKEGLFIKATGYINLDTIGSTSLEKEKDFFHWKDKREGSLAERWRIKTSNNSYYFTLAALNCAENNLDCSLCIMSVYNPKKPNESWKNYEISNNERKVIKAEFEKDILPKLKKLIAEIKAANN